MLLLESEALHDEVLVHEETSVARAFRVAYNLDAVDLGVDFLASFSFFLAQIFHYYFVLVVDVYDVDEAAVVSCEETTVDCVPKQTRVDGLVRIYYFYLHRSLRSFKPLKCLVERNGEDEVF